MATGIIGGILAVAVCLIIRYGILLHKVIDSTDERCSS